MQCPFEVPSSKELPFIKTLARQRQGPYVVMGETVFMEDSFRLSPIEICWPANGEFVCELRKFRCLDEG